MKAGDGGVLVSFGSVARNEMDSLSDRDVLAVGVDPSHLSDLDDAGASLTSYSWPEFTRMSHYGSLFLVHLAREGIVFDGGQAARSRYYELTGDLVPYRYVARDLQAFRQCLDDVADGLQTGDSSTAFEIATVATVIRHATILGCYLIGHPTFGRYSSVDAFTRMRHLDRSIFMKFPDAYAYRLALLRGLSIPALPAPHYVVDWMTNARAILEEVDSCA
jgi:hypothetical protein